MQDTTVRRRVTAATAGFAVVLGSVAAGGAAAAAPDRTAETSVDTTYLSDTLGVQADSVLDTITADRFQWLLQQPGQFAVVIGSKTDAAFKLQAQALDAAAKAAGASKVYWFDPNLTGETGIKNLDTRNTSGINLAPASQAAFSKIWQNYLAQALGNGIKSVSNEAGNSVTLTADDTVVNDSVDPVWDRRSGETEAVGSTDNVFFVYDKDRTVADAPDKIADWVNLSTSETIAADVAAAFAAIGGGSVIDEPAEFKWWQYENNRIQARSHLNTPEGIARYGGDILTDADDDNGWNVEQLTYPELLHLLAVNQAGSNFVILFGGTWCPNTRAVIKFVNDEAVKNDVKVYNFDLVLDGGKVNGTNAGANPIHVRDNANGAAGFNTRPSWVYGDVVRANFRNLVTQYDPHTAPGNRVAYYPGGNLEAFPDVVRKLQVPFLINYQRGTGPNPANSSVKRQWIQQNTDESTGLPYFTEYMSSWTYTAPAAQIGLPFPIDDESVLTEVQKNQLASVRNNQLAFGQEAVQKLEYFFGGLPGAVKSTRTVTANTVAFGTAPQVVVAIENKYGRVPAGDATLEVAGDSYTTTVDENAAVFDVAKLAPGTYPFTVNYAGDGQVLPFTETGSLTVTKATAGSTAVAAVKKPTAVAAGSYKVTLTAASGAVAPTGSVTVKLTKGSETKTVTGTLAAGTVTVPVSKLAPGSWKASVAYAGDANYEASTANGETLKVTKANVKKAAGKVSKAPTTKATGKYTVTVTQPSGGAKPTGTVTVTLKKGKATKTVKGTLKAGKVTVKVPKLAKGTWTVKVTYAGDATYVKATATGQKVTVKK